MLEFLVFSGVTNGFRSGNELLRYEKLLFSAKKTDFAVKYSGNSAKNAGSATILQFVIFRKSWKSPAFKPNAKRLRLFLFPCTKSIPEETHHRQKEAASRLFWISRVKNSETEKLRRILRYELSLYIDCRIFYRFWQNV